MFSCECVYSDIRKRGSNQIENVSKDLPRYAAKLWTARPTKEWGQGPILPFPCPHSFVSTDAPTVVSVRSNRDHCQSRHDA